MRPSPGGSTPNRTEAEAILGAMTAVVEPEPGTLGRQLVSAAASLVFELEFADGEDYAARSVTPTQLAETLSPATEIRTLAAELIGVAALSDGVLAVDRVREALAYASALGLSPSWTTDLSDVAGGRVDRAMHDMVVRNAATFPGLAGADGDPVLLPYTGRSDDDRRLYDRFASLEDYPEGSYGRAFWGTSGATGSASPGRRVPSTAPSRCRTTDCTSSADTTRRCRASCWSAPSPAECTRSTR